MRITGLALNYFVATTNQRCWDPSAKPRSSAPKRRERETKSTLGVRRWQKRANFLLTGQTSERVYPVSVAPGNAKVTANYSRILVAWRNSWRMRGRLRNCLSSRTLLKMDDLCRSPLELRRRLLPPLRHWKPQPRPAVMHPHMTIKTTSKKFQAAFFSSTDETARSI